MKRPMRGGEEIIDPDTKEVIGNVTSGTFSPCLQQPVAMAYINRELSKTGTEVLILKGGKEINATVSKMPFLQPNYYRG